MPSRTITSAIVLEAVLVAGAAAVFAFGVNFAANTFFPAHGLKLTSDYFPAAKPSPLPAAVSPPAAVPSASTQEDTEAAETTQRIKEKGLQPITRAETERLLHDPRCLQGLIVFIDARSESYYTEAHIPGAFPLDRYHPEKDMAADLAPCMSAEQVVVYCTGGECEDAEYTAQMLRDAGVPAQKIFVYGGGFDDWSAHHLPLEQGARNSGLAPAASK